MLFVFVEPQLYRVVHILRAHEPQLQNADVAEITLDLETVKAVTLRALEKFVNQCLKSKKPRAVPPPSTNSNSRNFERSFRVSDTKSSFSSFREASTAACGDPAFERVRESERRARS